jgi:alcohol dehydrogenase class IV
MADTQMPGISWRNPAAFAAGSVTQIGQRLRSLSATRVLLVSDEGLKAALHAGEAANRLHHADSLGVIFPHVVRFNMPAAGPRYTWIVRMIEITRPPSRTTRRRSVSSAISWRSVTASACTPARARQGCSPR